MSGNVKNLVFRGTVVIVLVGIIAKITAFVTEAILAAYLGTTYQSDAYYMVSGIQMVVYPMLSVGVWKVFLPLYKEKLAKQEPEKADCLTNTSITFFGGISLLFVILLIVFASPVVSVVAPGFEGDTRSLCIKLVRISSPMYVFIITSAVYAAILQCHNRFLGSQIREIASHIPTIIAALIFYKQFGIEAMAVALAIGGAVRLLIELPFVNWGYRYKPSLSIRQDEFRTLLRRMPAALLTESVTQVNLLVDRAMASMLPEGTVSSLNYGNKLTNVLSGLLSTAVATALYPQVIELVATEKQEELSRLVSRIISIFSVLMLPITVACCLFRTELVSVVFQRGSFDENSVRVTSGVFALYCVGVFFIACNTIITDLFYAYGDTKTPLFISVANLATNVLLNLVLVLLMGVNGLALATSIAAVVSFFIRIITVRKYVKLPYWEILKTALKAALASGMACMVPRILFWVVPANFFVLLLSSLAIGGILYLLLLKAFRMNELKDLMALIKRKRLKKLDSR